MEYGGAVTLDDDVELALDAGPQMHPPNEEDDLFVIDSGTNIVRTVIDIVLSVVDVTAYALTELTELLEWILCSILGKERPALLVSSTSHKPGRRILSHLIQVLNIDLPVLPDQPLQALMIAVEEYFLSFLEGRAERRRAYIADIYSPSYQSNMPPEREEYRQPSRSFDDVFTTPAPVQRPVAAPGTISEDKLEALQSRLANIQDEICKLNLGIPSVAPTPAPLSLPTPASMPPPPPPPPPATLAPKPFKTSNGTVPHRSSGSGRLIPNDTAGQVVSLGELVRRARHKPLRHVDVSKTPGGTPMWSASDNDDPAHFLATALMHKFEKARRRRSSGRRASSGSDRAWEDSPEQRADSGKKLSMGQASRFEQGRKITPVRNVSETILLPRHQTSLGQTNPKPNLTTTLSTPLLPTPLLRCPPPKLDESEPPLGKINFDTELPNKENRLLKRKPLKRNIRPPLGRKREDTVRYSGAENLNINTQQQSQPMEAIRRSNSTGKVGENENIGQKSLIKVRQNRSGSQFAAAIERFQQNGLVDTE